MRGMSSQNMAYLPDSGRTRARSASGHSLPRVRDPRELGGLSWGLERAGLD